MKWLRKLLGENMRHDDECPACWESPEYSGVPSEYECENEGCPVTSWYGYVDYGATWGRTND